MATSNSLAYPNYESIVDLYTESIHSMYEMTGGQIRAAKGKLVVNLLDAIVHLAWCEMSGEVNRLEVITRRVKIPIDADYVKNLTPKSTQNYIEQNREGYIYPIELDRAVMIDEQLVLGIECKSYAENAMLKRALKDFELALKLYPKLLFCLFQLENALGGDYGEPCKMDYLGSKSTYTLMSHSPKVSLEIITLLSGNRTTKKEIHQPEHFKEFPVKNVEFCVRKFQRLLKPFL